MNSVCWALPPSRCCQCLHREGPVLLASFSPPPPSPVPCLCSLLNTCFVPHSMLSASTFIVLLNSHLTPIITNSLIVFMSASPPPP